jgi:hypothetical protein
MVSESKSKVELRGRCVMELEQEQEKSYMHHIVCHRVGAPCCADVRCSHAVSAHHILSPTTLQQRAQVNARNEGLEGQIIPLFQYSVEGKRNHRRATKIKRKTISSDVITTATET